MGRKSTGSHGQKQAAFGSGAMARPPQGRWTTGVVVDYNPNTQMYHLTIEGVGYNDTVLRLVRDPGDITVLPPDTVVVVHDALGFWVIDAVLKQAGITPGALPPPVVTEVRGVGGEDPVRTPTDIGPSARDPNDPVDVLAGDWVRRSPDGNFQAVLAGGTNVMQSTPFAAVRTHAIEELVEIFAHQYRHFSAMGNLEIKTDNGKTSLTWRAGSDQSEENGPGLENWTIRLDVGATGDLFDLSITTPDGNLLSRIHLNAQGRVQILGVDGVDIVSGGDPSAVSNDTTASSRRTQIGGDYAQAVTQDHTSTVGGSREVSVAANDSLMVGNDRNEVVSRDLTSTVNGRIRQKVLGGLKPTPGVADYELELMNGGMTVVAGFNPAGMGSFNVVSNFGGMNFACGPAATAGFNVITTLPGSVNLGANGAALKLPNGSWKFTAIAPFGVAMFEPFATMMQALLTAIDTHVHVTAVGPTTPPVIPTTPIVSPMMPLIRSKRVSVGA